MDLEPSFLYDPSISLHDAYNLDTTFCISHNSLRSVKLNHHTSFLFSSRLKQASLALSLKLIVSKEQEFRNHKNTYVDHIWKGITTLHIHQI